MKRRRKPQQNKLCVCVCVPRYCSFSHSQQSRCTVNRLGAPRTKGRLDETVDRDKQKTTGPLSPTSERKDVGLRDVKEVGK